MALDDLESMVCEKCGVPSDFIVECERCGALICENCAVDVGEDRYLCPECCERESEDCIYADG